MAMTITEECVNCTACEPVCPNEAVTEGEEIYEIDPDKCLECEGEEQQHCIVVCPVDCIVKAA